MSSLEAGHSAALEAIKDLPPIAVEGNTIVSSGEPATTPNDATPAGNEPAGEAATPEDSFSKLDPNTLPPELRPFYTSMQGDYTRKMQEAAPFRTLAEETGLDADGLRSAAELYSALQDPEQLVQFHTELSAALQQSGLSPAEANAAATEHLSGMGQPANEPAFSDDPDERRIQELEARLARFESDQHAADQRRQQEQMQMALVAEMNRQEGIIRETHPDWTQSDIDAVYELSAFYGGSLLDASQRFDAVVGDRLARILNTKGQIAGNPAHTPAPPATPGVTRTQGFGDDLEAAHAAALEAAKLIPFQE